jgi:Cu-Zn family superoxide dismutase
MSSTVVALVAAGAVMAQTPKGTAGDPAPPTATAALIDSQGRDIGQARLQQTPNGILLKIDLRDATPGTHAVHLHQVGRCDAPTFESAGGHVTTEGRQHGFLNNRGPHAGDLPNLEVPASKQLSVEYLVKDVTLGTGAGSLVDGDGTAIVIHASKDDYASDPAGSSGNRIACGPIRR